MFYSLPLGLHMKQSDSQNSDRARCHSRKTPDSPGSVWLALPSPILSVQV